MVIHKQPALVMNVRWTFVKADISGVQAARVRRNESKARSTLQTVGIRVKM
jgi:hypothetical protein